MAIQESELLSFVLPSIIAGIVSAIFIGVKRVSKSGEDLLTDTIKLDRLQRDVSEIITKLDRYHDRLQAVESQAKIHEYRIRAGERYRGARGINNENGEEDNDSK